GVDVICPLVVQSERASKRRHEIEGAVGTLAEVLSQRQIRPNGECPRVLKYIFVADWSFKGQPERRDGSPIFVTDKRVLRSQLEFRETAIRFKIPRRLVDFLPRPTELRDDEGEAFGDCSPSLEAEIFDVASMERGVLSRGLLPEENRPQFGQRARILEPER